MSVLAVQRSLRQARKMDQDYVIARHPNGSVHLNRLTDAAAVVTQAACGLETRVDPYGRPTDPGQPVGAIFSVADSDAPELTCDRCREILPTTTTQV